jgi:hypothetical protein
MESKMATKCHLTASLMRRILYVLIHQAAGLEWRQDNSSLPDPYVILVVNGVRIGQTCTKRSTAAPVWNDVIKVELSAVMLSFPRFPLLTDENNPKQGHPGDFA